MNGESLRASIINKHTFLSLNRSRTSMGMTVNAPPFAQSPKLWRQSPNPLYSHPNPIIILTNRRPTLSPPPPLAISASTTTTPSSSPSKIQLNGLKANSIKWEWQGHSINYLLYNNNFSSSSSSSVTTTNPPVLLVHGFGASIPHWRNNINPIAQTDRAVYAIDLLGFGDSDKPKGYQYTMEKWAALLTDFLNDVVQQPTVLIGNSVGSLACVIAAAESSTTPQTLVKGLVLLNCSGGMNNKAVVDDWRIKLLFPLLLLIDFLLKQKPIASFIFNKVRKEENLRNILLSVYGNKQSVDDELVEIIKTPAEGEGALEAFVAIVTGPPGPNPVQLMPKISVPVLILWGDEDTFTPLDGPVGKYFSSLAGEASNISLFVLNGVGHCPHDDRPDLVHDKLLPWLALLPASSP